MAGVNKAILVGNLGRDPEVRHLDDGRAVANFSLATSEGYRNKAGERVTTTEWHNIVLWTPLAEIAEKYLTKGSQVYIEGRIASRSYDDKEGNKRYITEIIGQNLTMLGSRGSSESQQEETSSVPEDVSSSEEETDDLPF